MLERNDRVIVGVSGGQDSVCLVYILHRLRDKFGISLCAAHLNHILRGKESDEDMEFTIHLAERLSLPIETTSIDVAEFSKKSRLSLEDGARQARYDFFLNAARKNNASKIAVAHTKDDQAETVIMRFLRGSGSRGLAGIPATRKMDLPPHQNLWCGGVYIIRPLIEVWRKDIEAYLKNNKIPSRSDSSNSSLDYFRNKVRHNLLPALEGYNPNIKETLANIAENVSDDFEYINIMAKNKFASCARTDASGRITIDIKKLSNYHIALQKQVLRLAVANVEGNLDGIEFRHWKELEDLIITRPANSIVDLSKSTACQKEEDSIIIYRKE